MAGQAGRDVAELVRGRSRLVCRGGASRGTWVVIRAVTAVRICGLGCRARRGYDGRPAPAAIEAARRVGQIGGREVPIVAR